MKHSLHVYTSHGHFRHPRMPLEPRANLANSRHGNGCGASQRLSLEPGEWARKPAIPSARKFSLGFLAGLVLWFCAAQAWASTPTEQVRATVDAVLAVLDDGSLGRDAKRAKITELIDGRFDFQLMSKRALANNWKKASPVQQSRFVELFSELLKWTYIGRIENYSDEKVVYKGERRGKKNTALVNTAILDGTQEIPIDYKLVERKGEWRVYDVAVENVSLIVNYRNSYRTLVKQEGIDGLLDKMQAKVDKLKAEART